MTKDPFTPSNAIKQNLPEDIEISDQTIRKILVDEGYRSYKAKKKPHLEECHKKARIQFWNIFKEFQSEDFRNIIFSDESRICLMTGDHPPLVRRPLNTSLNEKYLRKTAKHPISIMVWGCFSYKGLGPLHIVDCYVNNEEYIKILEKNLVPYIQDKFS